jgi:hypothetical protein
LKKLVKSLPASLCPPGQRPLWVGDQREEKGYPSFDKWFDILTILSLSKEGDEGGLDIFFKPLMKRKSSANDVTDFSVAIR